MVIQQRIHLNTHAYIKGSKYLQWRKAVSLGCGAGKTEELHVRELN